MSAATPTIDVVVADKNPLVREGLAAILAGHPRFRLVGTAADGQRFLDLADQQPFHIGVIGWDIPLSDGRTILGTLRQRPQAPRIVVYTGNRSAEVPRQAMRLGAAAFCSKSDPPERLMDILLAVHEGRMVFPFMDMSQPDDDPLAGLTAREQDLLVALARGATNAQIAGQLDISLNTVKFHLKNLYGKLQVHNRAQAVAKYLKATGTG